MERSKSSHTVKFVESQEKKPDKVATKKAASSKKVAASKDDSAVTPPTEQKHLAACLMDKIKDKTDVRDVLHRSESFFKDKFRSISSERKEQKEQQQQDEDSRPKTPTFVDCHPHGHTTKVLQLPAT